MTSSVSCSSLNTSRNGRGDSCFAAGAGEVDLGIFAPAVFPVGIGFRFTAFFAVCGYSTLADGRGFSFFNGGVFFPVDLVAGGFLGTDGRRFGSAVSPRGGAFFSGAFGFTGVAGLVTSAGLVLSCSSGRNHSSRSYSTISDPSSSEPDSPFLVVSNRSFTFSISADTSARNSSKSTFPSFWAVIDGFASVGSRVFVP